MLYKDRRNTRFDYLHPLLVVMLVMVLLLVVAQTLRPKLIGGELYPPDFTNGFNLYIEESYVLQFSFSQSLFTETPHSVWLVSDEVLKSSVFEFCREIKVYRELDVVEDIMLGTPSEISYFPRIYFDTGLYCYIIEILNWDNYASDSWAWYPIRVEHFNKPVVYLQRIDLSHQLESESSYVYGKNYIGPDSVNSDGWGWYSTISQKHLDELLFLIRSVSDETAVCVHSYT